MSEDKREELILEWMIQQQNMSAEDNNNYEYEVEDDSNNTDN